MSVHESIFKEYDIRGKIGTELILDDIYELGQAIAYYFLHQKTPVKAVVIGKDGRSHSAVIAQEVIRACTDAGITVIELDVCPTAVVYFSLHTLPVQAGIMITASHCSKDYNGLKICLGKDALFGAQINEIKDYYYAKKSYKAPLAGEIKKYPMVERYTQWLADHFMHLKYEDNGTIIDCIGGAASVIMPKLAELMQWRTIELLSSELDSNFDNREPNPCDEKNMGKLLERVAMRRAPLGIAFDGDGDRMVPITHKGSLVLGDKLIALYSKHILEQNPHATIIYDVKCSPVLQQVLDRLGAHYYKSPSGHSLIKYAVRKHKAVFAGELSGHFFFKDRYFGYDDGIYAALRLMELINKTNSSLHELLTIFPAIFNTPEIRIACQGEVQKALLTKAYKFFAAKPEAQICTIDGVQATLPYGWGFVRSSHTQEMVSFRFASSTQEGLERIKQDFCTALQDHIDREALNVLAK